MAASDTSETTSIQAREKGPLFHEAALGNYRRTFSFSDVRPAGITVRKLEVEVDIVASFVDALKAKFTKSKVGDAEGDVAGGVRRKILRNVSGNFPAGTLTAIIGGSGSGKVHFHPHTPQSTDPISLLALTDHLPQCSVPSYGWIKLQYHRKHTLQRILRHPHGHLRICYPN